MHVTYKNEITQEKQWLIADRRRRLWGSNKSYIIGEISCTAEWLYLLFNVLLYIYTLVNDLMIYKFDIGKGWLVIDSWK